MVSLYFFPSSSVSLSDFILAATILVQHSGRSSTFSIAILLNETNEQLLVEKNFRGIKIFHLLFGAICLLEYFLLIMEQIAWVSRWFVLKKIYCQNVFVMSLTEYITLQRLYNYVDMIQSMNYIVCWCNLLCFENNMTKKVI